MQLLLEGLTDEGWEKHAYYDSCTPFNGNITLLLGKMTFLYATASLMSPKRIFEIIKNLS